MKIGIHDDKFHADEVFAVAILKLVYPDLEVIRTRDENVLRELDLRVDVGNCYDINSGDFDHHQFSFDEKRKNGIPYASAGLIWKHFGKKLFSPEVFESIDERLIQHIDADDNGIDVSLKPVYRLYGLPEVVSSFNCPDVNSKEQELAFAEAVSFATNLLSRETNREKEKFKYAGFIREKIKNSDGRFLVLDEYAPYKDIVIKESDIKFVIFPRSRKDSWLVVAIPKMAGSFRSRVSFPSEWGGKIGEELASVSGVKDAVFCHKDLFIAVAGSKESAIKLAEIALENKHF